MNRANRANLHKPPPLHWPPTYGSRGDALVQTWPLVWSITHLAKGGWRLGGASASLASSDQIIHLVPTCQEGIYHIPSTSSISLYPAFIVLSFRSLLSFFSLLTPNLFRFCDTVCGFDIKVAENINPGWTICSEHRDQARAKITLCSPQEERGKMRERKERVRKRHRDGGWESWAKMMSHLIGEKNVSKQCLPSLSKVKEHNYLIITLTLWCFAQFARQY